jgi:hypothetical protein
LFSSSNWLNRNHYHGANNAPQQQSTSTKEEFSAYHNVKNHRAPNEHRTSSESRLIDDYKPGSHILDRYSSRPLHEKDAHIDKHSLWTGRSPITAGSQPNLLLRETPVRSKHLSRHVSPPNDRRLHGAPVQHAIYASHLHDKPMGTRLQQTSNNNNNNNNNNQQQQRWQTPMVSAQTNRQQAAQSQYLDTNEFILRASHGQPLRSTQYPGRYASGALKDHRPQSMNVHASHNTMLDVYY